MDAEAYSHLAATFAAVVAALVGALVGFYAQIHVKHVDLSVEARRSKASQRLSLYLPVLRFCYEFDSRLGRILSNLHTDWLRQTYLDQIKKRKGFAADPRETGYFLMSSIYEFACFFGWTEAIARHVDATKRSSERSRFARLISKRWRRIRRRLPGKYRPAPIYFFDHDVSLLRRLFQHQELFDEYIKGKRLTQPRDACKLHRQFHHSIGEMMLQDDGELLRCKSFREFCEAYRDDEFRYWLVTLEELVVELSDFTPGKNIEVQAELKNDIRPLRLLAIRYWLRKFMRTLARDLGIDTPQAEEVLSDVSEPLREIITSVRLEQLELFLVGLSDKR